MLKGEVWSCKERKGRISCRGGVKRKRRGVRGNGGRMCRCEVELCELWVPVGWSIKYDMGIIGCEALCVDGWDG
jgi:hypothetical protein